MSIFVSESCLIQQYHGNKKYFSTETKHERDARMKREKYIHNRDINRLKASKRYYETKLNTITDNDKLQETLKKIEELEKKILEIDVNASDIH